MFIELWIFEVGDNATKIIVTNYKVFNGIFPIKSYEATTQIDGFKVELHTKILQRGFYNVFARNEVGVGFCDLEMILTGKLMIIILSVFFWRLA